MSNGEGQPKADIELVRLCKEPEGAFGVLLQHRLPFAVTLEHTYQLPGSDQFVKIPPGLWLCKARRYNRGGYDSYEVTGVPNHSLLLFHAGNDEDDTEGCILVGRRYGQIWDSKREELRPCILESKLGFDEFMRRTSGKDSFWLLVREAL